MFAGKKTNMLWRKRQYDDRQVLLIGAHLIAFPSILLFLVAGAVFGVVLGSLLVWIGTSIGQILAFCVGRSVESF